MHPLVNIAVSAARAGGSVIMRGYQNRDNLAVNSKQTNDFVTDIDKAAEKAVIAHIRRAYPDHDILAEESGATPGARGESDVQWVIDPIDGTTNFIFGMPHFAVSIGIRERGRLCHGVIFDPYKNELFVASRGRGATLDGKRIRVQRRNNLHGALIGTGMPFRPEQDKDGYLKILRRMMENTAGIRRAGAASLDLAYVAAGRLDGYWEDGLKPWDMAAGIVLVQEAGGIVGSSDGGTDFYQTGDIVAGTPKVFAALVNEIRLAKQD